MSKFIGFIFVITLLSSCSSSLVYSPSLNLTNTPLKEKEIDLQGGVEMMPETRPDNLYDSNLTTMGANIHLNYGFSDKFNMGVKGWAELEDFGSQFRGGFSLNGQFINKLDEQSRVIILPRFGLVISNNNIEGYGLGASAIYQKTLTQDLSWYAGLGFLWGYHPSKKTDYNGESKIPMGYGILTNLGISWQFFENFRLNCEINPIYQINTFDNVTHFIISPTLGIGYTIK